MLQHLQTVAKSYFFNFYFKQTCQGNTTNEQEPDYPVLIAVVTIHLRENTCKKYRITLPLTIINNFYAMVHIHHYTTELLPLPILLYIKKVIQPHNPPPQKRKKQRKNYTVHNYDIVYCYESHGTINNYF